MSKAVVLLIGGLDPQGCAGIAADMATITHHGGHALPLITAMTEQSSQGLTALGAVSADTLMAQFENCIADFDIKAVKIGLIPDLAIAHCVKTIVTRLAVPTVLDPVSGSSSGGVGVAAEVQQFICSELLPIITLLTPNLAELSQLSAVGNLIEQKATDLLKQGLNACLVKGGHSETAYATDYFACEKTTFYCYQDKQQHAVRGTGCVLASAIAAHLAGGQDIRNAIVLAKAYVSRGIRLSSVVGPYRLIEHSHQPLALQDFPKLCYQAGLIGHSFQFPPCPERLGIYPVVDSYDWVHKLVDENITTIQLRIKDKSDEETRQQIKAATDYLNDKAVSFFVNDHWNLAIEHQAYGVHLGQEDLHDANVQAIAAAGLRLGVSTHSYWELARALAINPSYIALGPIYETTSKQMPFSPQGIDRLHQWVDLLASRYPLVAIGGIDVERARELKATGVGSVAMITAITEAQDYRHATRALLNCWQ